MRGWELWGCLGVLTISAEFKEAGADAMPLATADATDARPVVEFPIKLVTLLATPARGSLSGPVGRGSCAPVTTLTLCLAPHGIPKQRLHTCLSNAEATRELSPSC